MPDAALVTVERTAPQIAGRLVADRPQRHPVGHGQKLRRHAGHEVRRRSELRGVPAGGVKLPDADPQKRVFETSEQVFVLAVSPVLQPDESDDRRQRKHQQHRTLPVRPLLSRPAAEQDRQNRDRHCPAEKVGKGRDELRHLAHPFGGESVEPDVAAEPEGEDRGGGGHADRVPATPESGRQRPR